MLRLVRSKSGADPDNRKLSDERQLSSHAQREWQTDQHSHALSCRELSYEINSKVLIDTVNLELCRNGCTLILGFNGAGKSLLLRLLHGMIKPTTGEVLWHGRPFSLGIRRKQAMVFQKPVLLRRSVIDNVQFVLANRGIHDKKRAMELLDRVDLAALAQRPARLLSGGEQQRLALGRALATEPDILFLDEATASLDPASVRLIEDIVLEAQASGTKVVMVTHDIGQAKRMAEEVLFMHNGEVVEIGPANTFFAAPVTDVANAYLEGRLP